MIRKYYELITSLFIMLLILTTIWIGPIYLEKLLSKIYWPSDSLVFIKEFLYKIDEEI